MCLHHFFTVPDSGGALEVVSWVRMSGRPVNSSFLFFKVTPNLAEALFRYRKDIEIIFNIIDKDHSGKSKFVCFFSPI